MLTCRLTVYFKVLLCRLTCRLTVCFKVLLSDKIVTTNETKIQYYTNTSSAGARATAAPVLSKVLLEGLISASGTPLARDNYV